MAKKKNWIKGKAISRKLLKTGKQITVSIPQYRNEPYVPIYMKSAIAEDKRNFFFK